MNIIEGMKITDKFSRRLMRQTIGCVGTATTFENNRWCLRLFLREPVHNSEGKSIHDHLAMMRFNRDGARRIKHTKETRPDDLIPKITYGEFRMLTEPPYTTKRRPAPNGISCGHIDAGTTAGTMGIPAYKQEPPGNFSVRGTFG